MLVHKKIGLLTAVGALGLMGMQAHANPISFASTGVDNGSGYDSNYTITSKPTTDDPLNTPATATSSGTKTVSQSAFITQSTSAAGTNNGFPLPDYWFSDNTAGYNSKWISPQQKYENGTADGAGYWSFSTTIQANVGDTFSGTYWGDNGGGGPTPGFAGVFLNGVSIAGPANGFGVNQGMAFNGTAGVGTQTLTFVVYNATGTSPNPTGVRVEADLVPEPAFYQMSILLAGGGLVALRQMRIGKRKKVNS